MRIWHIRIHKCIHIYIYSNTRAHTHMYMPGCDMTRHNLTTTDTYPWHICIHKYIYIYIYTYIYTCMYTYSLMIYTYKRAYTQMYTCLVMARFNTPQITRLRPPHIRLLVVWIGIFFAVHAMIIITPQPVHGVSRILVRCMCVLFWNVCTCFECAYFCWNSVFCLLCIFW